MRAQLRIDLAEKGGFFKGLPPPEQFGHHARSGLEFTLNRTKSDAKFKGDYTERRGETFDVMRAFETMFNGNWTEGHVTHWCTPDCCCKDVDECVEKCASIFSKAVLTPLSEGVPSESRWHTWGPAISATALGFMAHRLLPRVLQGAPELIAEAHSIEQQLNLDPDSVPSWSEYCSKKVRACIEFANEPSTDMLLSCACIVTAPIDILSLKLQTSDEHDGLTCLFRQQNPLLVCQGELFTMMHPGHPASTPRTRVVLPFLEHHFGQTQEVYRSLTRSSLMLSAQIWARGEVPLQSWPLKLLSADFIEDDASSDEEGPACVAGPFANAEVIDEFLAAPGCCLDSWLSEPLQYAIPTREAWMMEDKRLLLLQLRRKLWMTNMQMERRLRQARKAVPLMNGVPMAESMAYMAHLSTMERDHTERGGANPFQDNRKTMIAAQVPVVPLRKDRCRAPRPDVSWVNHKMASTHTDPTMGPTRKSFCQEYKNMTADERRENQGVKGQGAVVAKDESRQEARPSNSSSSSRAFSCGDEVWPISPEVMEEFNKGGTGYATAGYRLRWKRKDGLVASGDKNLIPHEHTFQKRFSCQQRHPGLCYSEDSDVYTSALQVAKNIEAWCTADKLHGYARIYNPDDDSAAQVLYIADKRSRRTYSPQVVVFALCGARDADELALELALDCDAEVTFSESPQGNGYYFSSVWTVAKHFFANFACPFVYQIRGWAVRLLGRWHRLPGEVGGVRAPHIPWEDSDPKTSQGQGACFSASC